MSQHIEPTENIICKNCETEFIGHYCPQCGQSIKDYEKPFGFLIYDLMGNMFAFDTRLWRTLKAVLFQPGKMAHDFVQGHRVRYMPPFRFYVFVSFVFFLMLNYVTLDNLSNSEGLTVTSNDGATVKDSILSELTFAVDSLGADSSMNEKELQTIQNIVDDFDEDTSGVREKLTEATKHPEYYIPQFIKYISWFLFFLMPLYGGILWLFFHKKYKYYLGHLIFAVNQHSFMFIIFILMMSISSIFPDRAAAIENWLFLIIPIYSIIGGRRLYQRKWKTIILRLIAIFFMYGLLLLIGVSIAAKIAFFNPLA